jgi:hypothetical protein
MADSLTIDQKYEYCQHKEFKEAAAKIARFMTECDDFGADVEFMSDKKIAAILNKMMIERFRNKAQSTLDAFLV